MHYIIIMNWFLKHEIQMSISNLVRLNKRSKMIDVHIYVCNIMCMHFGQEITVTFKKVFRYYIAFFIKHLNAIKIVTESEKYFLRQLFINQNMNWQKESFSTLSKKLFLTVFCFCQIRMFVRTFFLVQMWFRDICGMNVTRKSWMNTVSWIDL